MTEPKIGSTHGGETNFSALSTPVKEPTDMKFYAAAENVTCGDGSSAARGFGKTVMRWDALTRPQRNMLRTFCTGASATAFIYVPTNDAATTFASYQTIMHWPLTEKHKQGRDSDIVYDLEIEFTHQVAV